MTNCPLFTILFCAAAALGADAPADKGEKASELKRHPAAGTDTCLVIHGRYKGNGGNWGWVYAVLSERGFKPAAGDVLVYDMLIPADATATQGHVGLWIKGSTWKGCLRDAKADGKHITDQKGLWAGHIAGPARGAWYTRRIPLDAMAGGKPVDRWALGLVGKDGGEHVMAVDNIRLERAGKRQDAGSGGPRLVIYDDGAAPPVKQGLLERWARDWTVVSAPRSAVPAGVNRADLAALARRQAARYQRGRWLIRERHHVEAMLGEIKEPKLAEALAEARAVEDRLFNSPADDAKGFSRLLEDQADRLTELALAPARVRAGWFAKLAGRKPHLTADFSKAIGPATYRASGFLHGMCRKHPPDELVKPLKPQLFRDRLGWAKGTRGVVGIYERVTRLGATQMLVVSDSHGYGHAKYWPGEDGDWSRWEAVVESVVKAIQRKGYTVQYDIWNEPSIGQFWKPGLNSEKGRSRWLKTWEVAYKKIRELDPKAVIVGPSNGGYDPKFFKAFLEYAKANECVPDIFS